MLTVSVCWAFQIYCFMQPLPPRRGTCPSERGKKCRKCHRIQEGIQVRIYVGSPRRFKRPPRGFKRPQEAPRGSKKLPRRPHDIQGGFKTPLKRLQDAPKTAPRRPQDALQTAQDPQNATRWPARTRCAPILPPSQPQDAPRQPKIDIWTIFDLSWIDLRVHRF